MTFLEFKHVRSVGLKLAYDVRIFPNRYTISLEARVLKDASRPISTGGNIVDQEAARFFAIDDIEKLVGMDEQ